MLAKPAKKPKKRGRGRPPLPAGERKPDLTITVRTSPERVLRWAAAANRAGLALRTWIGSVCDAAGRK